MVLYVYNIKNDPEKLSLVVSVFALIILGTFSLHMLVMNSRIKILETNLNNISRIKNELGFKIVLMNREFNEVVKEYNGVVKELNSLTKPLNRDKRQV